MDLYHILKPFNIVMNKGQNDIYEQDGDFYNEYNSIFESLNEIRNFRLFNIELEIFTSVKDWVESIIDIP